MKPLINELGSISGFEVYQDKNLTIEEASQTRYPRSKKKRIQKKFKKLFTDIFQVPNPNFYILDKKIFCHPVYYEKLKLQLKNM